MKALLKLICLVFFIVGCTVPQVPAEVNKETREIVNSAVTPPTVIDSYNGEKILMNGLSYKILKSTCCRSLIGDSYFHKRANGQYLVLDVEVSNPGKDALYVTNLNNIKLADSDQRIFESIVDSDTLFYLEGDKTILIELLNPGITKRTQLVYDLPKDTVSPLDIYVTSLDSNQTALTIIHNFVALEKVKSNSTRTTSEFN